MDWLLLGVVGGVSVLMFLAWLFDWPSGVWPDDSDSD